ncbi:hypothetical protein EBZ39_14265 [bacterium]|nr:hypothetical protein [bacterium]
MAAPNLISPSTITGKSVTVNLSSTSATSVLSNAASSGKVLKVNSLYVANTTGSAAAITINQYSAAALGGTAFPIASAVSVPANATLVVIDKDAYIYLEENTSLSVHTKTLARSRYATR